MRSEQGKGWADGRGKQAKAALCFVPPAAGARSFRVKSGSWNVGRTPVGVQPPLQSQPDPHYQVNTDPRRYQPQPSGSAPERAGPHQWRMPYTNPARISTFAS
jgi:hypothetical protein